MDEGSIILDYWTPPGTSLTDTDQMLDAGREDHPCRRPTSTTYSRRTGTQLGFFITEPNRGDYVIKLKPRKRAARRSTRSSTSCGTKIASAEPAIHTDFGQLLEDNIGDLTGGVPQPIDVKIFGDDPELLEAEGAARRADHRRRPRRRRRLRRDHDRRAGASICGRGRTRWPGTADDRGPARRGRARAHGHGRGRPPDRRDGCTPSASSRRRDGPPRRDSPVQTRSGAIVAAVDARRDRDRARRRRRSTART